MAAAKHAKSTRRQSIGVRLYLLADGTNRDLVASDPASTVKNVK